MNLDNFLTSGHNFSDDEYDIKSKFILLNSMIVVTFLAISGLTTMLFLNDEIFFALINCFYLLMGIISLIILRSKKENYKKVIPLISFFSIPLVIIALLQYPEEQIRIAWFLIIIIASFFLGGRKLGFIVAFTSLLTVTLLYYYSDVMLSQYTFPLSLVILLLSTVVIDLYEKRETLARERLKDINNSLEIKVKEETKKRISIYEHSNLKLQSSAKLLEEQKNAFKNLAHFDALTGLPNRLLFYDRLEVVMSNAKNNNSEFSILFLDLDNFKEINDSFGHDVGDNVLKIVAARFKNRISKTDLLARLGGDEFTLMFEGWRHLDHIIGVAERLIDSLNEPIFILGHEIYITVSVGISVYPKDGVDIATLLKHADSAMYSAKNEGRNLYHFYKQDMTDQSLERLTLETRMRKALENNEFVVYYQPILNSITGELIGLETLVRWDHPEKGLLTPDKFIHVAERTSIIIPLGEYIIEKVATHLKLWHEKGFDPPYISINLSITQLRHKKLISGIKDILEKTNFRDHWLEFEITESYAMKNPDESIAVLDKIKALGVKFSIDDFGTGYSSLSHLKKLPVYKLKIDKSFIQDLPDDEDDRTLVSTIASLAKNMNLEIIAEGVETQAQRTFLEQIGCSKMQGYLFAKPLSVAQIESQFIEER